MKDIYILGSLNTDLTIALDHFPEIGETIKGKSFATSIGGKGLNQAVAAAKLGSKVHFLGAVGGDGYGTIMKSVLQGEGVDCSHVKTIASVSSGLALIEVSGGLNRICINEGSNKEIKEEDVDAFFANVKSGDIFLFQGENNIDASLYAAKKAKEKGMYVIFNPAPAVPEMKQILPYVDAVTPNENEAKLLGDSIATVPLLVVTLGDKGYEYTHDGKKVKAEARKVNAVDSTGAGDAFVGSFAHFLSMDLHYGESLRLASLYATLSVTKKGGSSSMASPAEFKAFIEQR